MIAVFFKSDDCVKSFAFTEEIVEEPMVVQNSLFVEPAAAAVEVSDVAVAADLATAPTGDRTASLMNDQEQTTLVAVGNSAVVLSSWLLARRFYDVE